MPSRLSPWIIATAALAAVTTPAVLAADVSVREFTTALFTATASQPVTYAGRDFTNLDLSGTDFKRARLARSNLFGADLTESNLSHADLSGTNLDRTTILGTDFSGADLTGATMLQPAAFLSEMRAAIEAPRFKGATLTRLRATGQYWRVDFSGTDLRGADFSPFRMRSAAKPSFKACDFSGSDLTGASLREGVYHFSSFVGANLSNADLSEADFSRADLTGANLTGAKLSKTILDGATLTAVRGLDAAGP